MAPHHWWDLSSQLLLRACSPCQRGRGDIGSLKREEVKCCKRRLARPQKPALCALSSQDMHGRAGGITRSHTPSAKRCRDTRGAPAPKAGRPRAPVRGGEPEQAMPFPQARGQYSRLTSCPPCMLPLPWLPGPGSPEPPGTLPARCAFCARSMALYATRRWSSWRATARRRISRSSRQRGTGHSLFWHCFACTCSSIHIRLRVRQRARDTVRIHRLAATSLTFRTLAGSGSLQGSHTVVKDQVTEELPAGDAPAHACVFLTGTCWGERHTWRQQRGSHIMRAQCADASLRASQAGATAGG